MEQKEFEQAIAGLFESVAGRSLSPLDRKTPLADLGLDSLSKIDLAVAGEDRFGVQISDEALEGFKTVGDLMDYLKGDTNSGRL